MDRLRASGVLLPIASLPGPYGIGDLGPSAREFASWLASAGQQIWQVLPVTVVDRHGCPYASPTAFAREPLYLSPDDLADDGFIAHADKPYLAGDRVDWPTVDRVRAPFLKRVGTTIAREVDLDAFRDQQPWVETWALFAALRERHGHDWTAWPTDCKFLAPDRRNALQDELSEDIARHVALQWAFVRQWTRLRNHTEGLGIQMWGDLPFFVGNDSADVWSRPELFDLDPAGRPRTITGVPPDAFSPTGQLWGHPHFVRAAHSADDWSWWVDRVQASLELVDVLRLDHFRGLDSVWEVLCGDDTAENGRWVPGPGRDALEALRLRLGEVPLIAEDLGVITDTVEALRDDFGLPGMAILQFAFGEPDHAFLPHHHRPNQVVYTGTHDNDTVAGWFGQTLPEERERALGYLHTDAREVVWSMIRGAWRSVADTAIVPMQDLLSLGSHARMNVPGQLEGNWSWRLGREALNISLAGILRRETVLSGRAAEE